MKTQVKFLSGLRVGEISKHTSKPETPTGEKKKKKKMDLTGWKHQNLSLSEHTIKGKQKIRKKNCEIYMMGSYP